MGGSVSTGVDNDDLVDNLLAADYIKTPTVERVFRAVDRGMYFTESARDNAYKDSAWKSGNIHLSAPCIYCEVMENLELGPGMSFLNLGSGTGYLNTMAGLILGSFGLNHGVEIKSDVIQYAEERLEEFKKNSPAMDEFDFCEPKFVEGNCLQLDSDSIKYDRVYCGAACPPSYEIYMRRLIKVGGILVVPLNDRLLSITRVSEKVWKMKSVLPVAFATLIEPSDSSPIAILPKAEPIPLMDACRTTIRSILQVAIENEHPELKVRLPPRNKSKKKRTLQRLLIPMLGEHEVTVFSSGLESRDEDTNSSRGEASNSDSNSPDRPSGDDAGRSPSPPSREDIPRYRIHVRRGPRLTSTSTDSDDSSPGSGLTSIYQVQRALFQAMSTGRNEPQFTGLFTRPQVATAFPAASSVSGLDASDELTSSDSSVPHDDSSDSMDVDQSGDDKLEAAPVLTKSTQTEGTPQRAGNKRKESEMEETDSHTQSTSLRRSSQASSSSSSSGDCNQLSVKDKQGRSNKRKTGPKREKVDSGIGEDIQNWDASSAFGGIGDDINTSDFSRSDEDALADSDSEDDLDVYTTLNGIRRKINRGGCAEAQAMQENKKDEVNAYVKYMRSKIGQLPLPLSIKSFINYHRDL